MQRKSLISITALIAGFLASVFIGLHATQNPAPPSVLPEFTQTKSAAWFNSKPLKTNDLKGKVILLDFWTFECWNCYRSFPWLHTVEEKFKNDDFQVIGIHTPEFEHEKIPSNIKHKIKEFKLTHPVMMDNDFRYWKSMNNRYWPSFYIIDKKGNIRGNFIGETHVNTKRANDIETLISELLKETI